MRVKLRTALAVIAAAAAIISCIFISKLLFASASSGYAISLTDYGSVGSSGSAAAGIGDSRFVYSQRPQAENYEVLCYITTTSNELVADGDGAFYPAVPGYTDEDGGYINAAANFSVVWCSFETGDSGGRLSICDATYMLTFTFNWYNPDGELIESDTNMGVFDSSAASADAYCVLTMQSANVSAERTLGAPGGETPQPYQITYDTGDGQINGDYASQYTAGDSFLLPADVTREGYTFLGWYDGENNKVTAISATDTGDKTFTAKWELTEYNICCYSAGSVYYQTTYTYGTAVTLPTDVTREGHDFLGWYDGDNKVTSVTTTDTGDKTFTAKWTFAGYLISYETSGGTITDPVYGYVYGEGAVLPTLVTREGYTFLGWYDGEDNKVTTISTTDTGDKTFTAKWELTEYTIYCYSAGGVYYQTTYTYGSAVSLPSAEKTGYTFLGWYDSADNKVTEVSATDTGDKTFTAKWELTEYTIYCYSAGSIYYQTTYTYGTATTLPTDITREGYDFLGWQDANENFIAEITADDSGDKTFTAVWQACTYSVELDAVGGIAEYALTEYTYGKGATLPSAERTGYNFLGWYAGGNKVTAISVTDTGDKTFTAKWEIVYEETAQPKGYFGEYNGNAHRLAYIITAAPDVVITYQWYFNGKKVEGASAAEYFTAEVQSGYYYCAATLSALGADDVVLQSSLAAVEITPAPPETFTVSLASGAGYALTATSLTVEEGGSVTITLILAKGFTGGEVCINGVPTGSGMVTLENVTGNISVTVSGIAIDKEQVRTSSVTADYDGQKHSASAIVDIDGDFVFKWHLDGELIATAEGKSSSVGFTQAGQYALRLVVCLADDESVNCEVWLSVTINKIKMPPPAIVFDADSSTIILISDAASGFKYPADETFSGDMLVVNSAGEYIFYAIGDENHEDSDEFSVIIYELTFVSGDEELGTMLAAAGGTVSPDIIPKKAADDEAVYEFAGWLSGGEEWDGIATGNLTLTAHFTKNLKSVSGTGGITVSSDNGFSGGAHIVTADADEQSKDALLAAGEGVLLHSVDIKIENANGNASGTYTVTYPLPPELWGVSLAVYHYSGGAAERLQSYVSGGNIVFVTTGFSPFGFFDVTEYALRGIDGDGNSYYLGSHIRGQEVALTAAVHPAETGYIFTFEGWFSDAEYTKGVQKITLTADTVLYAKFSKTAAEYVILATDNSGGVYYVGAYEYGSVADLTKFSASRVGDGGTYTYKGLYLTEEGGDAITGVLVTGNLTLHIRFDYTENPAPPPPEVEPELEYYTLAGIYGDEVYYLGSYESGQTVAVHLMPLASVISGDKLYVFEGWYTDEALTEKPDTLTVTANTALYAKFVEFEAGVIDNTVHITSEGNNDDAGIPWAVIIGMAAVIAVLLAALLTVLIVKRREPSAADAGYAPPLSVYSYDRAQLESMIEEAENYIALCPDRQKKAMAQKARTLLGEYTESNKERTAYEISALISEIYNTTRL